MNHVPGLPVGVFDDMAELRSLYLYGNQLDHQDHLRAADGTQFKTGGLGLLMEEEGYETWQCIRDHFCATDAADPWFCFVYHETRKVFTPWGHNSQLKLVAPAPCACNCSCA